MGIAVVESSEKCNRPDISGSMNGYTVSTVWDTFVLYYIVLKSIKQKRNIGGM
jgi:hypothetical protein